MRFDWYSATVPTAHADRLAEWVGASFSQWAEWRQERPRNGYAQGARLYHGDLPLATMYYGGAVGEHGPHVFASGQEAVTLAEALRKRYPGQHRVSRVDACEDYRQPGAFAAITGIAETIALERKVKAKWVRPARGQDELGATLYLGAATSDVRVRCYEKGKQLRETGHDENADPDHVRAEIQVRPHGVAKSTVAEMSPANLWGLSGFSHELAQRLGNAELQRVHVREWRTSDMDRAIRAMGKQYARPLTALLAQSEGCFEAFGRRIWDAAIGEWSSDTESRD